MTSAGAVALFVGIAKGFKRKSPLYFKAFLVYIVSSIFQGVLILYFDLNPGPVNIDSISANIFTIIEFIIFSFFFLSILQSKAIKYLLIIFLIGFPLFCTYYWLKINSVYNFPYTISVVEAFCFLVPCFFYFYEVFTKPPTYNLSRQPQFWITTGILFYFITMIPSFLIMEFLEDNWFLFRNLGLIGFFSTSLLYSLIVKGFLCKNKQII